MEMTPLTLTCLFLVGFTLHNLEEALWLPAWSQHAARFHAPVSQPAFVFAVSIITLIGYFLAAIDITLAPTDSWWRLVWPGFVGMMVANAIMPHLAATLLLRRYAPGLGTGLLFNLPLGLWLLSDRLDPTAAQPTTASQLLLATFIVSLITLVLLKPLFRLGEAALRLKRKTE